MSVPSKVFRTDLEVVVAQRDTLVKTLEAIAAGTTDWVYPYRAMGRDEMKRLASEALRDLSHEGRATP